MEIYSGAHLIPCEFGGRPLILTLLVDENGALLFDAGTRAHAESSIPEYFRSIGFSRERLEERRVGKECSKQCRSRWSPYH